MFSLKVEAAGTSEKYLLICQNTCCLILGYNFSYIYGRATCPAHFFLIDLVTLLVTGESTNHAAPHYALFCSLPFLPPSFLGPNKYSLAF